MAGRMNFDYQLGAATAASARRLDDETPMRILLLSDYSGRGDRQDGDLTKRRPLAVDIDTFDQVLRRIAPRLNLPAGEDEITFSDLDDFHPDALYKRVPVFEHLRDLRVRLQNPATFAQAAEAFRAQSAQPPAAPAAVPTPARARSEDDGDTLSRLFGRGASSAAQSAPSPAEGIDAFIRNIVADHIEPDAPAHQAQYLSAIDAAIAAQMRSILHAPQFQALESAWRGLYWLVTNLELGETLKLYVLDVTKAELLQDMQDAGNDLTATALYKTLVEAASVAGAEPWSLVAADYEFGAGGEDITLLATLGVVASHAGAPLIGGAAPPLAGCDSFAAMPDPSSWKPQGDASFEAWQSLRRTAMAPWVALAAPRMLLRLPYGKSTDAITSFDFDELGVKREHDAYLWGNGALACVLLLGRAFLSRGWDMEPGDELDVEDLPAHTYEDDGEKHLQACAEAHLSERAGQAVLDRGLIPLLSYKNRNAVRVMRFQSIAEPATALSGPWK